MADLNKIFDVHVGVLTVIENELQRLHHDLQTGNGDTDVVQEQICNLHSELARLSEQLGDMELELIEKE